MAGTIIWTAPDLLVIILLVFFVAGLVKGLVGLGMPTTSITLMSFFITPVAAIGLNLLPMMLTNFWQFSQAQNKRAICQRYAPLACVMLASILGFSFLTASLGNQALRALIGLSVIAFSLINLLVRDICLPASKDRFWQVTAGLLSGILGGLTSLWGVPITLYMLAARIQPREFVDGMGFLLSAGCVPLMIGYASTGVFVWSEMWLPGLVGTLGGLAGFQISSRLRSVISPARFRQLVLWLFLLMGIRMCYGAIAVWLAG